MSLVKRSGTSATKPFASGLLSSEAELVKISPRGQIVIPKDIREVLGLEGGERLGVKAQGDVILLKKVEIPELKENWEEIFRWGESLPGKKGLRRKT